MEYFYHKCLILQLRLGEYGLQYGRAPGVGTDHSLKNIIINSYTKKTVSSHIIAIGS